MVRGPLLLFLAFPFFLFFSTPLSGAEPAPAESPPNRFEKRIIAELGAGGLEIYRAMDGTRSLEEAMKEAGASPEEMSRTVKWLEARATEYNRMANAKLEAGEIEESIGYFKFTLELGRRALGNESPRLYKGISNLAGLLRKLGKLEEAETYMRWALRVARTSLGPEHQATAAALNNLAVFLKEQRRLKEAEELYRQALEAARKAYGPDTPPTASAMTNLAMLLDLAGRYQEAEPLYEKALEIDRKTLGPRHPITASDLNNLALLYASTGRYAEAEPLLKEAIEINEEHFGPESPRAASALGNLAMLYVSARRHEEAGKLYRRVLSIDEKAFGPEDSRLIPDLNNLAALYKEEDRLEEAERLYIRALDIGRRTHGTVHPAVVTSMNNLALLYDATGRNEQAEKLYRQVLDAGEKLYGPTHPALATSMNNLALLYHASGRYEDAAPLYKRAIEIGRRWLGPGHPNMAAWLNNLALLYAATGRHAESHRLFSEALAIEADKRENVFTFLSEKEKILYMRKTNGSLQAFLGHTALYLIDDPRATRGAFDAWLAWKGAVMEAQTRYIEALGRSSNPRVREAYRELRAVRQELAKLQISGPEGLSPTEYQNRLSAFGRERERLEAELSRLSRRFALEKTVGRADAGRVAAALPDDSLYVDIAQVAFTDFSEGKRRPDRYLAFVLEPDAEVRLLDLGEVSRINKRVADYLFEMERPRREGGKLPRMDVLAREAKALHALLIEPLAPWLENRKKLYLSPDGNLNLIPFEVFMNPDGKYLLEDYRISYVPAGRDMLRFGAPTAGKEGGGSGHEEAVVLSDPDYDLRLEKGPVAGGAGAEVSISEDLAGLYFPRLPETAFEAGAIKGILNRNRKGLDVRVLMRERATEEELFGRSSPLLLHMATHGFFLKDEKAEAGTALRGGLEKETLGKEEDREQQAGSLENPMLRSGLALAGANRAISTGRSEGVLSAEKILGLDLGETGLVVLSACDTGVGDVENGEGVFGLKRAFILAGADSVVMSLWSVPSSETAALMTEFYGWLSRGLSKAEALREARLTIRDERENPFYWGAFVLTGEAEAPIAAD